LAQLRQDYVQFKDRNAEIVAIGATKPERMASFWEKQQLPFRGIPDPDKQLLDRLGQEFKLSKFGRMPALLIVDLDGSVRFAHYGNHAGDIPSNEDVLALLDRF
jgi:peroxiredoxin